jgi:hypothetical protein
MLSARLIIAVEPRIASRELVSGVVVMSLLRGFV